MDVYQIITDRIIGILDGGAAPWRQPWTAGTSRPVNLVSHRPYRGVNVFLLASAGYAQPEWCTYKQAQERGGNVKRGEKATPVIFWHVDTKPTRDADTGAVVDRKRFILRYYNVFNVQQCEGLSFVPIGRAESANPIQDCERVLSGMPEPRPTIQTGEPRAWYAPALDVVNMPPRELFADAPAYYATLFHELSHATAHASRLNRPLFPQSDRLDYGREELIAEMGAAFLCAEAGISPQTIDNSAAYLAGWARVLRGDSRLVVQAAAAAQRAADWILGRSAQTEATEETAVAA